MIKKSLKASSTLLSILSITTSLEQNQNNIIEFYKTERDIYLQQDNSLPEYSGFTNGFLISKRMKLVISYRPIIPV